MTENSNVKSQDTLLQKLMVDDKQFEGSSYQRNFPIPRKVHSSRVSRSSLGAAARVSGRNLGTNDSTPILNRIFPHTRKLESGEKIHDVTGREPKSILYTILNPRSHRWPAIYFKWFISTFIVADLVMFVISTEPYLSDNQRNLYHAWEGIASGVFLVEYLCRLYSVTESRKYGDLGPIWGRCCYATTTSAIIDALAILPFFLELFTGWNLPTLTFLRTFRLLRILKTNGMVRATDAVWRVLYYNRQILYVALFICILMIIATSVLMYYLRPRNDPNAKGTYIEELLYEMSPPSVTLPFCTMCIRLSFPSIVIMN